MPTKLSQRDTLFDAPLVTTNQRLQLPSCSVVISVAFNRVSL